MSSSTLFPPNREHFSDAVISSVVQREAPFRYKSSIRTEWKVDKSSPSAPSYSVGTADKVCVNIPSRLPNITGNKRLVSDTNHHDSPRSKVQKTRAASVADGLSARYAAELELRRQRNRIHQARYKTRQRKLVADLEDSVKKLKTEIPELELQHRLLSYDLPSNTTIWAIAAEYCRLFRHGVKTRVLDTVSLLNDTTPVPTQTQTQLDFFRAVMAHDVTDGVVFGVQALMSSIALQSQCYQEIDLQPLHMNFEPGDSLVVTTKCELTITERTMCYGFPNLVKNGKWSSLAVKMLGKKIVIRGSMHFVRDVTSGRVTRLQWKADLLTPLLHLLGSLEAVSRVFNGARLSPEGLVQQSEACS
ncbi:hypothetical protein L917_12407 [Phytophthora nicotianae]|uniref:BZIP domain-containing protein n=1 Tax=Phytophthora nicotianae TaxID=4792 RepID=W2KVA3_PHYNI|nr:hypothetical protein L915_12661 [Phytophthora nicotianae]ETL35273.1 hypothetical protein L916_12570 [Phytophthora nicotianae]ETL88519.1 hypothetical protein L917_12407 [Phytophthora nicotianae]